METTSYEKKTFCIYFATLGYVLFSKIKFNEILTTESWFLIEKTPYGIFFSVDYFGGRSADLLDLSSPE